MKVTLNEKGQVVVVTVDRSILQENVPLFKIRLSELLEEGKTRIVLDMSSAAYLSSMGVAVIVDIFKRTRKAGGGMNLACVNHLIRHLLDMTNVTRKVSLFDTVDEAVAALQSDV
ncbi:MAG: STAS domain-containing protein [Chitinivibrionales bacterium]